MGQWVDITTIDNQTPFMKVRWKGTPWSSRGNGDCWFSEASGLTTDNMSWTDGNKNYGWFSAHRMNGGNYLTYPIYCCSFNFDHTRGGYWDSETQVYRDSVNNAQVSGSGFYDTTVVIDGETYYEIDFSLWAGASGYQLYAPYQNMPWDLGDVFVYVGSESISGNTNQINFLSVSGTDTTFEITAADDWAATVSDNWVSLSSSSGTSGTSGVDISVTANQSQSDRTATVTFLCSGDTFELTVNQYGIIGVTGDTSSITFKAGGGSNTDLTITADVNWTAVPSDNWITVSPSAGTPGYSAITITAEQYTGTTSPRTADITFSGSTNTFTVSVTQKKVLSFGGFNLGQLEIEAMYLGGLEIEAMYLGDQQIYAPASGGLSISPGTVNFTYFHTGETITVTSTDEDWALALPAWITADTVTGTTGTTTVNLTVDKTIATDTTAGTINATSTTYTASCTVNYRDYSKEYLTLEILSDGYLTFKDLGTSKTIQYSRDNGETWTNWSSSIGSSAPPWTGGTPMEVYSGETILLKGTTARYGTSTNYASFEGSDVHFNAYGNLLSLSNGNSFSGQTSIGNTGSYHFRNFFSYCNCHSMKNLVLSDNTLNGTYAWFAQWNTYLTEAPEVLPMNSIAQDACKSMFRGTAIERSPEIIATALTGSNGMQNMFNSCSNLNYVKCLASSGTAYGYSYGWLDGVSATGTFVKAQGATWASGVNGIPEGWTVIEE